jgi:membrane protein YdbS with pleckstrin-like domain
MTFPTDKHNVLSAMVATPRGVCFEAQRDGEQILLLLRAHIITQFSWILVTALGIVAPLVLFPLFAVLFPELLNLERSLFGVVLMVFWYLVLFFYAFEKFLLWFFGVYIISTQRLIDIDFVNFFTKQYAEAQISRVQDVSSQTTGPLQVMFNYGLVSVQTAGETPNIEFESVPEPVRVGKFIGDLVVQSGGSVGGLKVNE